MHRLFLLFALAMASSAAAAPRETANVAYGPGKDQRYDVYWDDATRNAPVIVMLHGGGWAIGDKANRKVWKEKSAHYRASGFIFVSVNTRLLPEAAPDGQAVDLARALADIQARARDWGGDPANVILMGHSAGAHLAALVGTDLDLQRRHGVRPIRGTVALDGAVLDVADYMTGRPSRLHRRAFGTDPAFWDAVSPAQQLDRGAPPVLAVCSTERPAPCPQARDFARTAAARGIAVSVLPVAMSHGAINGDLGKPSAYTRAVDAWIAARLR